MIKPHKIKTPLVIIHGEFINKKVITLHSIDLGDNIIYQVRFCINEDEAFVWHDDLLPTESER